MSLAYQQVSSTTLRDHFSLQNCEWSRKGHGILRDHCSLQKCEWSRKSHRIMKTFRSTPSQAARSLSFHRSSSNGILGCSRIEPDAASGAANVPFVISYDATGLTEKHECTANATSNVDDLLTASKSSDLYSSTSLDHDHVDEGSATPEASTSSILLGSGENVDKGKIRRFSLNDPDLLKTVQEAKLTPLEKANLEKVMKFKISDDSLGGTLVIQTVRTEHMKDLETLLTDSYSELMWGPLTYRPALAWILSTYLRERQACIPNAAILVGLYSPLEERTDERSTAKVWLAGAVEISFNASGKPKDMPTPLPPEDAAFLSNMAVLKKFRRRGIGRKLLKGAEQLAFAMGCEEMYLQCRMIDEAPLNMYQTSGYSVVETNSILSLLLFQRRRHLMYKRLGKCFE